MRPRATSCLQTEGAKVLSSGSAWLSLPSPSLCYDVKWGSSRPVLPVDLRNRVPADISCLHQAAA